MSAYRLAINYLPPRSVLQFGSGSRAEAFELAQRGADVVGIDDSPLTVTIAHEQAEANGIQERTSFYEMDSENLGFISQSFDVVFGASILHRLDRNRAFSEISRVLRPDGRGVFLEPFGHNPLIAAYRALTSNRRRPQTQPLHMSDLALAKSYFANVEERFFHFATLAAVPLRNSPFFGPMLRLLERVDQAFFAAIPALRGQAWMVLLVVSEPRPQAEV